MTSKPRTVSTLSASVSPEGSLEVLSQLEVHALLDTSANGLYRLFRNCSLAVLNSGSHTDNAKQIYENYLDFGIHLSQRNRGINLRLENAPAEAFVDGEMIHGIREHLFAVLRDIIYVNNEIQLDPEHTQQVTDSVFHILRNADVLQPGVDPNLVVCWGGHSISESEYQYTKEVGYECGLRNLDICTGCGPGAMKGPMKGAAVGHAKQRNTQGRYIGLTEPGIIASEPPNPMVNDLVIMPDIEKRLEAFVRSGHGVVIFPGGAGTIEELLYLLGILMHPDNAAQPFPLILTGAAESAEYFATVDAFIGTTLGPTAQECYEIIIDDPKQVARSMKEAMAKVRQHRIEGKDAFYFNWRLKIAETFQTPFKPTHEAMAGLNLNRNQEPHLLAAMLRRAFSGIVAGNVKEDGIRAVEKHGPFVIHGERDIMVAMDKLLCQFVSQQRMKLEGEYVPCYRLAM